MIFGLVAAPLAWVTPGPLDLAGLLVLGIVSMAAHVCVNRSLKIAPASVVAPYQYTLMRSGPSCWAIWRSVTSSVSGRSSEPPSSCGAGLALILLEREAARRGREAKDIETPVLPEA